MFLSATLRFLAPIVKMLMVAVLCFDGRGGKGREAFQCTTLLSVDIQRPIGFRFRLFGAQNLCPYEGASIVLRNVYKKQSIMLWSHSHSGSSVVGTSLPFAHFWAPMYYHYLFKRIMSHPHHAK